jgi:hypothetical protein
MEVAERAIKIEGRTNLLFSFEKMAIRDAVKSIQGACGFAVGLYEFLYGKGDFDQWCAELGKLPRKQTRVLTWPVATVFPFIAMPKTRFPEAECDPESCRGIRIRIPLQLDAVTRDIRQSAGFRGGPARRHRGPSPEGRDRHPVVSMGAGFG